MSYPRETVEFIPITVAVDGAPVSVGVQFCVTSASVRPLTWVAPTALDGKIGILIDNMAPGYYTVWAQVTDTPETPVIECGTFTVT